MQIQLGKKYQTNDGRIATITREVNSGFASRICMLGYVDNIIFKIHTAWNKDGKNFATGMAWELTLIKEIVNEPKFRETS